MIITDRKNKYGALLFKNTPERINNDYPWVYL
jgi:hypothetical protein